MIGHIEAWRSLRVHGLRRLPRLFSTTGSGKFGKLWPTREWFYARCSAAERHEKGIPGENCRCGVYALNAPERVIQQGYTLTPGVTLVMARVGLAGRVLEFENGYRAERARVLELFVPYEHYRLAAPLGAAYNVPVSLANIQLVARWI